MMIFIDKILGDRHMKGIFQRIAKPLVFAILFVTGSTSYAIVNIENQELAPGRGDTVAKGVMVYVRKLSENQYVIVDKYSPKMLYINIDKLKGKTYLRVDGCKETVYNKHDEPIDEGYAGTLYFTREAFQSYLNYQRSIRTFDYPVAMGDFGGEMFHLNSDANKWIVFPSKTGIAVIETAEYNSIKDGKRGLTQADYMKYSITIDFESYHVVEGMYIIFQYLGFMP